MARKNRRKQEKRNRHNIARDAWFEEERLPYQKAGVDSVQIINRFVPKNDAQVEAVEEIRQNTLTFIGGPAGTAKTFIAVSQMVEGLVKGRYEKGIISRPTVEAGWTLGFLPGTAKEKLDPYVRPIYDCLEHFVGIDAARGLIEDGIIEIVPFQFMRGRTFSDAFIILDETQNATPEQLRLALTRIGYGTKCVVTYDRAQIDLDLRKTQSSVDDVQEFKNVNDIGWYEFATTDICRAPIVATVLDIYRMKEERNAKEVQRG